MRKRNHTIDEVLDRGFTRHGEPSHEQMAVDLARVRERLEPEIAHLPLEISPVRRVSRVVQLGAVAALMIAVGTAILWRPTDTPLYRIVEGDARAGETIRSNGGGGAVLELADSSRIEMRSNSELSFERASDGVRIRLTSGGIIVNAARQRAGHLYVQTKDMTVSVVGTVFLVNADGTGSRVGVIEGEVRVQQGANDKKLLPGDQVATSPAMAPAPITEEIGWSRNAEQHRALLRQSAVASPPVQSATVPVEPRPSFAVVSIRPAAPSSVGARGAGPLGAPPAPSCSGVDLQVDAGRFAIRNIPLYGLISLAYGKRCQPQVQHVGGLAWMRTDGYDIEAAIPPGSPVYTAQQLRNGAAPQLELMLQAMLVDRFKLVLGREMREMSVYNLIVVTPGRLKPSADQNPPERVLIPGAVPQFKPLPGVVGPSVSMSGTLMPKIIELLQSLADRPVIDRTELTGRFDFLINWPALTGMQGPELPTAMRDQLSSRLEEQAGLKLEPVRALVEVLVIERAERPTEN
jgi:uncharacterized protein (TIGR03435 family)